MPMEEDGTLFDKARAFALAGSGDKPKRKKSAAQRASEKQADREQCTRRIAELEKAIGTRRDITREADRRIEDLKRDKKKAKGRSEKAVFQRSIENERNGEARREGPRRDREVRKQDREAVRVSAYCHECDRCHDCGQEHAGLPWNAPCPSSLPRRVFQIAHGDEVLVERVDSAGLVAALLHLPAGEPVSVTWREEPPSAKRWA